MIVSHLASIFFLFIKSCLLPKQNISIFFSSFPHSQFSSKTLFLAQPYPQLISAGLKEKVFLLDAEGPQWTLFQAPVPEICSLFSLSFTISEARKKSKCLTNSQAEETVIQSWQLSSLKHVWTKWCITVFLHYIVSLSWAFCIW